MAKRKKKRGRPAKAPVKALRKKTTKTKATGKRKVGRPAKTPEVADPIKGKFLIEKDGNFLLKLNELGEQVFAADGTPSDFVAFANKADALDVLAVRFRTDEAFTGAAVVPFGKYFGVNHRIDTDVEPPKLIQSLAWLSINPVPLKAAVKTARAALVKLAKDATEETKAAVKEIADDRKNIEAEIKARQKELATFAKDAVKDLKEHYAAEAALEDRLKAFDRQFK